MDFQINSLLFKSKFDRGFLGKIVKDASVHKKYHNGSITKITLVSRTKISTHTCLEIQHFFNTSDNQTCKNIIQYIDNKYISIFRSNKTISVNDFINISIKAISEVMLLTTLIAEKLGFTEIAEQLLFVIFIEDLQLF